MINNSDAFERAKMMKSEKIGVYDYRCGRDLIEVIKKLSGIEKDRDLAEKFDISYNTIRTWCRRDITPFEFMMRACIALQISPEELALKSFPLSELKDGRYIKLKALRVVDGIAIERFNYFFDTSTSSTINSAYHEVIINESGTYIIDIKTRKLSGEYFIELDDEFIKVKLQRLPGDMVQMEYGKTTATINADDLKIIGRIKLSIVSS